MTSFMTREELEKLGLKSIGTNVLISRNATIYGAGNISIGSNVRIDDFCILSGNVQIGNFVHIAAYSAMYGSSVGIKIDDFANISSRVCVYAVSDDFSGETMTSPMIPEKYKNVTQKPTSIGRHVIIGTGSTVLPGSVLEEGCVLGAMTLVKGRVSPWNVVAGVPARKIRERSRDLLKLEEAFLKEYNQQTNKMG